MDYTFLYNLTTCTRPSLPRKTNSSQHLRGAIQKEAGQLVFCPSRGGDLAVKIGQNKSCLITVQKCEESSHSSEFTLLLSKL